MSHQVEFLYGGDVGIKAFELMMCYQFVKRWDDDLNKQFTDKCFDNLSSSEIMGYVDGGNHNTIKDVYEQCIGKTTKTDDFIKLENRVSKTVLIQTNNAKTEDQSKKENPVDFIYVHVDKSEFYHDSISDNKEIDEFFKGLDDQGYMCLY